MALLELDDQDLTNGKRIFVAPTVFVVDDDVAVSDSLARVLGRIGLPCECHFSAESFLLAAAPVRIGCAIVDVRMPGMGGLELLRKLAAMGYAHKAIAISGHADVAMVVEAMRLGASTFLEKPCDPKELIGAVREVMGVSAAPSTLDRQRAAVIEVLSQQERSILQETVRGRTDAQIAEQLDISRRTVQMRRVDLMKKLSVRTKTELIDVLLSAGALFRPGKQI